MWKSLGRKESCLHGYFTTYCLYCTRFSPSLTPQSRQIPSPTSSSIHSGSAVIHTFTSFHTLLSSCNPFVFPHYSLTQLLSKRFSKAAEIAAINFGGGQVYAEVAVGSVLRLPFSYWISSRSRKQ